jgi:purine-binding chemotaxis protein CheW
MTAEKVDKNDKQKEAVSQKHQELAGKYLTFKLSDEVYGLEILKVIEIIGLQDITPVPRTPDYVKGVINLRGIIHPVIDLKKKFGMGDTEHTEETCIIIVVVENEDKKEQMGVMVDSVSEVVDIDADIIEDAPNLGMDINSDFILGMAKAEDSVKILLNVEKVLSKSEIEKVSSAADQVPA